jgi:uncharacterized protein (TIGR02145 family)
MNSKNRVWFILMVLVGFILILIYNCKKTDPAQQEIKPSSIIDGEGNIYGNIKIGTQIWLTENLKTTKYSNGDPIGTTASADLDIHDEVIPKYEWAYNGNEDNVATYGRLYTWYTIADPRGVCPTGWHVPSDDEWLTLENYLGGYKIAGGKLKETGTTHWTTPNYVATNESGFTALPNGWRHFGLTFVNFGKFGGWWSSTEYTSADAFCNYVGYKSGTVTEEIDSKKSGIGVRCLKNN